MYKALDRLSFLFHNIIIKICIKSYEGEKQTAILFLENSKIWGYYTAHSKILTLPVFLKYILIILLNYQQIKCLSLHMLNSLQVFYF